MRTTYPFTSDLVFIGGGHTHALVLHKWGMRPLPGARLTLINPGPTAPYTGMLPGFVAGHYTHDDLSIDLVRLARFAGARLILGAVDGFDTNAQTIHVPGRPAIPYDVAAINIGITSDLPNLPGFSDHAFGAKPLGPFAAKWQTYKDHTKAPKIAVIGGGVGGIELALAMAHALQDRAPTITVIERATALPGLSERARSALLSRMKSLNINLLENTIPTEVMSTAVITSDGRAIPSTFTVGVAGARAHPWLLDTGLAQTKGFLMVDETLKTSNANIYATGDCAQLPDPRPKAGVFAVREAPFLYNNLRAQLTKRGAPKPYRPQSAYLKLISLGEKSAVADKWGGRLCGPWVWRWKDRIDRKFMDQFTNLPSMKPAQMPITHTSDMPEALGAKPMCGGCGAKVGGNTLTTVLKTLPKPENPDILYLPGDDAAILRIGQTNQVLTTDHLRAFTEDPWVMAKIAAHHALGDIFAMGATPQAALATVILPRMTDALQGRWLREVMAASAKVMTKAGATIVGGHTSLGSELTIGFSISGVLDAPAITLAHARPGDVLILTKPIGSGTILAGEMQQKARGDWVTEALAAMMHSQDQAAKILAHAHAMTDVTGFGLAGHLMNIARASDVAATLDLTAIPLLDGALELAQNGIRSTLYPENRKIDSDMQLPISPRADLLFDPQTAGGLLAAIPPETAQKNLQQLHAAGYPAAIIGEILQGSPWVTVTN